MEYWDEFVLEWSTGMSLYWNKSVIKDSRMNKVWNGNVPGQNEHILVV